MSAAGTTIATTTTAADGTYSFTSDSNGNPLPPDTYKVTETQPAGYLQGSNTVGTVNGASDGTLIPVDMIGSVVLSSGQNSINNNFGELKPVTISGNVYEDKLGTGAARPGRLTDSGNDTYSDRKSATIATTITAADGTYSFTSDSNGNPLPPATYKVTETQPAGYLQGTIPSGPSTARPTVP